MDLDDMIERARALPERHPLRTPLLVDMTALRDATLWLGVCGTSVPSAAFHVVGLALSHLQSRLSCCEERVGEQLAVPA